MKIRNYSRNPSSLFDGTVAELIEELGLKERYDLMYTLTTSPSPFGDGYQFKAFVGPFSKLLFEICGHDPEEILEAVKPLIEAEHIAERRPAGGSPDRHWFS